jgi:superfamily II RNA helicase
MDNIGFALIVPGPTMDIPAIWHLLASSPSHVPSRVQISFSMVLNLLLSHTPAETEQLLRQSFAAYPQAKGRYRTLVRDFQRHLSVLQTQGYVHEDGTLTGTGRWASQLRVDQPLLIAEGLRRRILPASDPALLAGAIACFVCERETDDALESRDLPRRLEQSILEIRQGLRPFILQTQAAGFRTRPLYLRPAAAMYAWATGRPWSRAVTIAQVADGDLTMLISRTADNLRHIQSLGDAFPRTARTARQAIDLILREPVTLQYE